MRSAKSIGPATWISLGSLVGVVGVTVAISRGYENHDVRITQVERDAGEIKTHAAAADERSVRILEDLAKIKTRLGITD